MGRSKDDPDEKRIRTIAWYNDTARRVGTAKPFQTAKAFGAQFIGSFPEYAAGKTKPTKWLDKIEAEYPGTRHIYEHGPGGLWDAIWCEEADLWKGCYLDSNFVKQPSWRKLLTSAVHKLLGRRARGNIEAPLVSREIPIERSLENFQGWFAARYVGSKQAIDLRVLSLAIRLYRIRLLGSRLVTSGADGTYEILRTSLSCPIVQNELSKYGVHSLLIELVEGWEHQRIMRDWQHRHQIELLGWWCNIADPIAFYVGNPLRFTALIADKQPSRSFKYWGTNRSATAG